MISSKGELDLTNQIVLKRISSQEQYKQEDTCFVIEIDHKQEMMASGCGKQIRLWSFKMGQLSDILQLEGHQDLITCLLFSKMSRSLISASQDCQLRLWKQNINQTWSSSQPFYEHLGSINSIIMNYSEDILFSGSSDQSIKVWAINIDLNEFKLLYQLRRHTKNIIGLTLAPSESILASSGLDNQIIIWRKSSQGTYDFNYVIKQSVIESGCRLTLLNDNKLIWVSRSNEVLRFFEEKDGIFRENTDERLNLKCSPMCIEQFYFPIFYNQNSKILALKNKFHFYIMKQQPEGYFLILHCIEFKSTSTFGTITNDGRFIVYWNNISQQYEIYELRMQ
ncbi:unnamed protein product [Paramecium octaurelia]|uniref:Uncharacterized protein n=1 Tax=Paramecium octaurelia TaxID=43137 RepID=A0A8S1SEQ0_PAROT|nr:unnamed protein product [Paramecium octaurelia]